MFRDPKTSAFFIHLAAYVLVNAILAVINLMEVPPEGQQRELWFLWPLAGWGIGVAAHGIALVMERKSEQGGWMSDKRKRGFAIHATVYVAVNALLVAVDWITSPGLQWVYWPIAAWGVGLAAHGLCVWRTNAPAATGNGAD